LINDGENLNTLDHNELLNDKLVENNKYLNDFNYSDKKDHSYQKNWSMIEDLVLTNSNNNADTNPNHFTFNSKLKDEKDDIQTVNDVNKTKIDTNNNKIR
jgi:hypothetical protein